MCKTLFQLIRILFVVSVGVGYGGAIHAAEKLTAQTIINSQDSYSKYAKPVIESRCVACHACFNAPCQLNMTSYEGLERGASSVDIYDFPKLEARPPSRILIDAHRTSEWRERGFFPVLPAQHNRQSIWDYLIYSASGVESGKQATYESENSRACMTDTSADEIKRFEKVNPAGRMPFGLPGLSGQEVQNIERWRQSNDEGPDTQQQESRVLAHSAVKNKVEKWEKFFNRDSLKAQLSSRYIYEHLFLAHIYLESQPDLFFRLVRSATKSGDIVELATRYPFDDPGQTFYYRLRPVVQTIVHKNHIPFPFSDEKMKTWDAAFYQSEWASIPEKMPAYGSAGANPYLTFAAIPAEARYRWFLDEAGYHVMTFIKGPVCRGQTALNVINDHFWTIFVDPSKDISVTSPETYNKIAQNMALPAAIGGDFKPTTEFRDNYWRALQAKYAALKDQSVVFDENMIWNGDQKNSNALLTIYRHFDSSAVLRGLRGEVPKTVWVLDYHVFESIYYNLTAGYDVFGPVLHQVNSRLFMEISRIASEDLFITFMPQTDRAELRAKWNIPVPKKERSPLMRLKEVFGKSVEEKMYYDYAYPGMSIPTAVDYASADDATDSKHTFIKRLLQTRFSAKQINASDDVFAGQAGVRPTVLKNPNPVLRKFAQLPSKTIQFLPDAMFLRFGETGKEAGYTVVHNKAHLNVGMLFFEDVRRNPMEDSLDILPGAASPYINFMLHLTEAKLSEMVDELAIADGQVEVNKVLAAYGINRNSPYFWENYEWFSNRSGDPLSNESGWLDLNRYINL